MPCVRTHRGHRRLGAAPAALAALLLAMGCGGGQATEQDARAEEWEERRGHAESAHLRVWDAWMPEPANPEVGAVYLRVANHAETDDALTSVSTDVSDDAEIHDTETTDSGAAVMRQVEEVPVPAEGEAELAPGGYHVMVEDLARPLEVGDEFTLTLTFASEEEVVVTVPVQPMTAGHGEDSGHDHH